MFSIVGPNSRYESAIHGSTFTLPVKQHAVIPPGPRNRKILLKSSHPLQTRPPGPTTLHDRRPVTPTRHGASPMSGNQPLADRIDALLPQTQCGKCGHPGCRPYARAVADGEAHNQCPPGGQRTCDALAELLDRPVLPLDERGHTDAAAKKVAYIREDECI